jgi:hypothetical protein
MGDFHMSKTFIVNNIPFEYPEQGEQQPWGESATAWAEEVTRVLNSVKGPADLLETRSDVANNVTIFQNVTDCFFDSNSVRSFNLSGNVYRKIGTVGVDLVELYEQFELNGVYTGSLGWRLQQESQGNAGVTFQITPTGQIQYKSSNVTGDPLTYEGILKYKGVGISNQ